jgi:CRISPR-associated protein Cas2
MRLMVFFDLPVVKKEDRRAYTVFRRFLLNDGYDMLQFSVYARVCRGVTAVEQHVQRVTGNLPSKGSVRALHVTDRQYDRMRLLLGTAKNSEKTGAKQMVLL